MIIWTMCMSSKFLCEKEYVGDGVKLLKLLSGKCIFSSVKSGCHNNDFIYSFFF